MHFWLWTLGALSIMTVPHMAEAGPREEGQTSLKRSLGSARKIFPPKAARYIAPSSILIHRSSTPVEDIGRQCGWFAIYGCFSSAEEAWRLNDELELGQTIETNMEAYPNFDPGYFCVVKGPTTRTDAEDLRRLAPGAYIKQAC